MKHSPDVVKKLKKRYKGVIFYLLDEPTIKEYKNKSGEVYSKTTTYNLAFIDKDGSAKLATFSDPYYHRYGAGTYAKLSAIDEIPWYGGRSGLSKSSYDILLELLTNKKLTNPEFDLFSMETLTD